MSCTIYFAGTSDALGVPRVYCNCTVCEEARGSGNNRRTRSSIKVTTHQGSFWLDCGPDWREQMEKSGDREANTVLLTHAHQDHIGGIPELYDYQRYMKHEVRVLGPSSVLKEVADRYPWTTKKLRYTPVDSSFQLYGMEGSFWEVCHGYNGRSFAYRFIIDGKSWVYCPDSINLNKEEQQPLYGLDLLILGTSFYKEDGPVEKRSVYSVVEALELIERLTPQKTLFTHLSHGVDIKTHRLPEKVSFALDGLLVQLTP